MNLTTLYINSITDKMAQMGSSGSKFKINLLDIGINDIKEIIIKNIIVPFSYYSTIYADPNLTTQTINIIENGTPFSISLDAGNYNESELASYLQTELTLNSPALLAYAVVFNKNTYKFQISVPIGNTANFEWTNNNMPIDQQYKTLGYVLGWISSIDPTKTIDSGANTVNISPFTYNLSGPNCLYLKSSRLGRFDISFNANERTNVICDIPVGVNSGSLIVYPNASNDLLNINYNNNFNNIDFELIDHYGHNVNLNGQGIILSIIIKH